MEKEQEDHLIRYLTDAYSIEQQALAQLRTAPDIAGEETLARHFRQHLDETELQADLIRQRLEAHGASPRRLKDAVMVLGGKGFVLFARSQPDTPGKLLAHAHSYEALEWASYEMLMRMAQRAGDTTTAATARRIRDQEQAMLQRLASCFDQAVQASLAGHDAEQLETSVRRYLADAHALEKQSIELLEKASEVGGHMELDRLYGQHLEETRVQARQIEARLDALGGAPSSLKDAALAMAGREWGLFFQAQGDTPAKLAAFVFAVEHLEIAGYELLRRVAEQANDGETARLAQEILAEERAMTERVAGAFDRAFEASLESAGAAVG
jgi:ferritin-like metal-binding protein YciE